MDIPAGALLGLLAGALAARRMRPRWKCIGRAARKIVMAGVTTGLAMLLVHLAGAVAGVLACRWLERRWGGGAGLPRHRIVGGSGASRNRPPISVRAGRRR